LNDDIKDESLSGIDEEDIKFLQSEEINIVSHTLHLTFQNYSTENILQTLLPNIGEITCKFEKVGHIGMRSLTGQ